MVHLFRLVQTVARLVLFLFCLINVKMSLYFELERHFLLRESENKRSSCVGNPLGQPVLINHSSSFHVQPNSFMSRQPHLVFPWPILLYSLSIAIMPAKRMVAIKCSLLKFRHGSMGSNYDVKVLKMENARKAWAPGTQIGSINKKHLGRKPSIR